MQKRLQALSKEKKIIYGVAFVLFIIVVTAIILGFSFQERKDNINKAISSLDTYQVIIEAKNKDEELGTVLYQYDHETEYSQVSLRGLTADIEKQYYDKKAKALYYQNVETKQYQTMELETDYSFVEQLKNMADKKNEKGFFQPEKYCLSSTYLKQQFAEQSNLMFTYLTSLGYHATEKEGTVTFTLQDGKIRKLILEVPTSKEAISVTLTFLPVTDKIELPGANQEIKSEMLTTTEWMILYVQRLYAEGRQDTKAITDVSYILNSKYKEELKGKILAQPIDVRLRVEPSTTKDTGVITGTITYEGDVVVTIENSAIVTNR